jgi:hypothetical protein
LIFVPVGYFLLFRFDRDKPASCQTRANTAHAP